MNKNIKNANIIICKHELAFTKITNLRLEVTSKEKQKEKK